MPPLHVTAPACLAAALIGMSQNIQGGANTVLATSLLTPRANHVSSGDDENSCGDFLSSYVLAALLSFASGVLLLLVLNATDVLGEKCRGQPVTGMSMPGKIWEVCGGLIGCSVMMLGLLGLQATGFALTSVLRASATACASLAIDHIGLCGTMRRATSDKRVLGLLLLLVGSGLSGSQELMEEFRAREGAQTAGTSASSIASVLCFSLLPLFAGILLPIQGVVNRRLTTRLGRPLRAVLVSFLGGSLTLAVTSAMCGAPHDAVVGISHAPWYAFTGGALGLLQVLSNVVLPKYIGFATMACFNIFGTLSSALVVDAVGGFGFVQRPPTAFRIAGVAVALLGAVATRLPSRPADQPLLAVELRPQGAVNTSSLRLDCSSGSTSCTVQRTTTEPTV